MKNKKTLLVYFGHHKCMTTWINSIIYLVCRDLNLKYTNVHNAGMFENKLDLFCKKNNINFLSYTNADIRFVRDINDFLGFHVIRDPRDIVVSAYFSHHYSHPTEGWPDLIEHREKLQKSSQEEGLFLEMEFCKKVFEDIYNWDYSQANVLEIKMEDMIISPYEMMVKALVHLRIVEETTSLKRRFIHLLALAANRINTRSKGLIPFHISKSKIPVDILLGYIFQNRFSKKSKGRKRGEEDVSCHFRKGVAGDWVNYFNQEHRSFFKEKYNDMLIKLGYEKNSNW